MHSGDLATLGDYEKHNEDVTDEDKEMWTSMSFFILSRW